MSPRVAKIAAQNDLLRTTFFAGRVVITEGILALPETAREEIIIRVRTFDAFTPDNDPYGEHDFGCVTVGRVKAFWKIDYYDRTLKMGSDDPADPAKTCRVLTIMLAEEY
jgi:hypothetical protein